ncbi:hypothetical protein C2S53_009030 [Perilla frutescens var. hirtella]|uniref:Uncharacterized protein n=1 Tax=Perilla frutescens var. hirtella TaxID=608512 RepID=A0AAD4JQJ1_PERFH|nr:hypothetical protein C2S53_009030 [Perilla frutescens var. hirtella]
MERLLNQYDKECMKIVMLKHEETFREQVYELHRLYRIQKMLMKDIAKNAGVDPHYRSSYNNRPESKPVEALGGKCRASELEYDQSELELTLGPRSYYQKKIKAAEPGIKSDNSGPSFSSSSTGSSRTKGAREELLRQQKWGPETPVSNQDRLNSPPWLFQALSLNMT